MKNLNVAKLKRLNSGYCADIFEIDAQKVLKLSKSGWKKEDLYQEYLNAKIVNELNIPSPKVFDFFELEDESGKRYGYTMEKVVDYIIEFEIGNDPLNICKVGKKMAEMHAQIHNIEAPKELCKQEDFFEKKINTNEELSGEEKKKLLDCYYNVVANNSENKVCHGDFHSRNILTDKGNYWIIDWIAATGGNPYIDSATTYCIIGIVFVMETDDKISAWAARELAKEYLQNYSRITGRSEEDILKCLPLAAIRYSTIKAFSENTKQMLYKIVRGEKAF